MAGEIAAAYGIETAIEGGIAAYYVTKSTLPLKAHLEHIATTESLQRSSHTLSVISDRAYIFGGEKSTNEIAKNDLHELHISTNEDTTTAILRSIPSTEQGTDDLPSPRVGHSASVARDRIFIFGGHEGKDPKVIEEHGRIWVFDPIDSRWTFLDPPPNSPYPTARSRHASTASPDGKAVFIHGGASPDGSYLADVWGFYLDEGKWKRLPDAPDPLRINTNLTCGQGKLWRFGSRSSEGRVEGQLDFLDLSKLESDKTQFSVDSKESSPGVWETWRFDGPPTSSQAPVGRSSAALHYITKGSGRDYLLLALGESDQATKLTGNQETTLLSDIWAYQLPASMYSGAGVKDAIRGALPGINSNKGEWAPVEITGIKVGEDEEKGGAWTGRSHFGSAMTGTSQFMIWGGRNAQGEILGDGWRIIIE